MSEPGARTTGHRDRGGVGYWVRENRLASFLLLAFGISWGVPGLALALSAAAGLPVGTLEQGQPLAYVAVWAPAIAAFTVVGLAHGRAGLRAYARRVTALPGPRRWYAAVLVGVPLLSLLPAALVELSGGEGLVVPAVGAAWLGAALLSASLGPFEEFGWRGFALPLLQRRYGGFQAAVLLGFVWGLWHLPGFFLQSLLTGVIAGDLVTVVGQFLVATLATSLLMTVVFNATGGSVPLLFAYHLLTNLPYPWEAQGGIPLAQVFFGVLAALAVAAAFARYLDREHVVTKIFPGDVAASLEGRGEPAPGGRDGSGGESTT